jgi:hypothetical protein
MVAMLVCDLIAARNRVTELNIWADYDAIFQEDALEVLAGDPTCLQSPAAWAEGE